MKRGFLLKAADKKNGPVIADKPHPPSKAKDTPLPTSLREDTPSDNLTNQEKTLPDYCSFNENFVTSARENLYKTVPHIRDGDGSTEWVIRDPKAEGIVNNTPGYPARTPKPRRPDLYEVRMTPDMGQGVFAKHNIKRGDLIFSERPLLVAPNWVSQVDMEYTPDQWDPILRFEEEKALEGAVQRMNENDRALYMALYNSHTTDGTGPLMGIMRTNGFSARRISDTGDKRFRYSAICNIGSRLNHSCLSNVTHSFNVSSFSVLFSALRDIKAGEQLYHSYCSETRTKAERQTDLAPYGFSCTCSACVNATPASDNLRRTFQDRVSRLDGRKEGAELLADLVSAKQLESEMIAEGLDPTTDFLTVQCVLSVASGKLGRRADEMKYRQRVKEYCKIHIHDRPELGMLLTLP